MKVKELIHILEDADPEAVVVNYYPDEELCLAVENVYVGSLSIKPKWSLGGQMIADNGAMADNKDLVEYFKFAKDTTIVPAVCIK